ncbi:MAG: hypothetical protein IJJ16_05650 [Mogibacterium sp.]|nr:hypothetical protein [Mogibacterium sp.]
MKNGFKRILVMTLSVLMALAMLTGCGPKKPTASDAKDYVQALMDMLCTGTCDSSVNFADVEDEGALRDNLVNSAMEEIAGTVELSDVSKAKLSDFLYAALGKCKYTVGEPVEVEGGFDVPVTIEPLIIYASLENFDSILQERAVNDMDLIMNMSDEELMDYVVDVMVELLNDGIADPQYEAPVELTMHYRLLDEENNIYGCSEEDGAAVGSALFSTQGL